MDWQPMTSAPRDGRDIIVGYGHSVVAGAFWYEPRQAWFEVGMDPTKAEPCEPFGWIPMPDGAPLVEALWDRVTAPLLSVATCIASAVLIWAAVGIGLMNL